jgi:hypothetical protein
MEPLSMCVLIVEHGRNGPVDLSHDLILDDHKGHPGWSKVFLGTHHISGHIWTHPWAG